MTPIKVDQYLVLNEEYTTVLEEKIENLSRSAGWMLYGPLSVVYDEPKSRLRYIQAMILP